MSMPMEYSQKIARFLAIAVVMGTIFSGVVGLAIGYPALMLDYFLVLALLAVGCLLIAIVNRVVIGPSRWLTSRIFRRNDREQMRTHERRLR